MLKDECDIMRKQHEEEKEDFVKEIRKLKEQLFDLDEVRRENDYLNLKMSILWEKGVIDNEGNLA